MFVVQELKLECNYSNKTIVEGTLLIVEYLQLTSSFLTVNGPKLYFISTNSCYIFSNICGCCCCLIVSFLCFLHNILDTYLLISL